MGYRSEVQISLPYDSVKEISSKIDGRLNELCKAGELDENPLSYNLLRTADSIYTDKKTYCIFHWEYIKFDDYYLDVRVLLDVLKEYRDDDYLNLHNICVIGEDGEVLEQENDNECIPCFYPYTRIVTDIDADLVDKEVDFECII